MPWTVAQRRAHRRRRRAAGLCPRCGRDAQGYCYCDRCRELHRAWLDIHSPSSRGTPRGPANSAPVSRAHTLARRRAANARKKAAGLCRDCGAPVETGARCERCKAKARAYQRRRAAAQKD